MALADRLRAKAQDYAALCQEQSGADETSAQLFAAVEIALREFADAVDAELGEHGEIAA
jgi:hypothetical protein